MAEARKLTEKRMLYTRVKVTGMGVRILQRYYGLDVRHPDEEFAPKGEVDVSPTWTEIVA